ncbi:MULTISPECIES: hypothetical protein [Heyndrickxia]|uniref:hypothetical protein n=1 Tax=Heyndrickxia TaxID=2837504 RepID=UPI0015C6331F|nr:hypothetical protein [Heyndrickxia coagulans]
MNERKLYKSPLSALLWSAAFPGFGQLYNGDYFIGFLLMLCTAAINFGSNLNMSVYIAFKGNFGMASERFHPEWGIFFPAVYCFSLWQAFNQSVSINRRLASLGVKKPKKATHLTGFFFGMLAGFNFGLFWHFSFFRLLGCLRVLDLPVINGLVIGSICATLGHWIESLCDKHDKK